MDPPQVATVPTANRVLVMNHLSHGYFADRYGLRVAGAVIPSVSSGETVSAKQMAGLVKTIETQHVKAIFVEIEENPELADQIAAEAHVKVITDLLDHSLDPGRRAGADVPVDDAVRHAAHRGRAALETGRTTQARIRDPRGSGSCRKRKARSPGGGVHEALLAAPAGERDDIVEEGPRVLRDFSSAASSAARVTSSSPATAFARAAVVRRT